MHTTKERAVPRVRLLYDKDTLEPLRDEYESPAAIKDHVETAAKVYEIRTALRYWFGGSADYRTSDRIWKRCRAVENGLWVVVNDQLRYGDEVDA
jgi:hypothetical protein